MAVAAVAAGVDTWSPGWSVDPGSSAGSKMVELATVRARRGGELLPEPVAGHRVGWFRESGLIFAEGHPVEGRLARATELPAALDRLVVGLREGGIPIPDDTARRCTNGDLRPGFAGMRRLDSTVDLRCDTRHEGMAILVGVAAVATRTPRAKADIWFGAHGLVESVLWRAFRSNRVLGRFYDKGLESGAAGPGMLLRPEDQRRWQRDTRPSLEGLRPVDIRRNFRARFEPLYTASRGVTVAPVDVLAERLLSYVDAGEMRPSTAEKLAGYMLMAAAGGTVGMERTTRWRRERKLRELGLVPDTLIAQLARQLQEDQDRAIELRPVLEAALESDLWEQA